MHAVGLDQRALIIYSIFFTDDQSMKHQQQAAMQQAALLLFLSSALLLITSSHLAGAAVSSKAPAMPPILKPVCLNKCGDVDIHFPFGISEACALPQFKLTCNHSFSPPRLYTGNLQVMNITVETGEMRVVSPVSYICYNSSNTTESDKARWSISLSSSFLISRRRNTFTAIGCSTLALLRESDVLTGCISSCDSLEDAARDKDECAGLGCCQTPIPGNLSSIDVDWGRRTDGKNPAWKYSPCSYAFVAEKNWYHFYRDDLKREGNKSFITRPNGTALPLVLDWAIKSDRPCYVGSGNSATYACASKNSICVRATQENGYLCNCSQGFEGNPYLAGGCINIDERDLRKSNPDQYGKPYPCHSGSTCHDTLGSYECKCKFGHRGNATSDEGCQPIIPGYAVATVATLVAVIFLAALLWVVHTERKKRQRKGYFDKNGGKLLKGADIHIYTEDELKMMTKQYSEPIGGGKFGKVFMGITKDNQQVAVKRSIVQDSSKTREGGEFVDEITFQFEMRHKNLVRLVGCCLETDVPMLVFEFVPNGSLADVLHGDAGTRRPLSLLQRLDIAIGSAEALRYMHYSHTGGHHKRIHGDVKSANILLDDNFSPKVSDFGSSKVMSTTSRYVRFVASDMNYVDPVYLKTYRFTEKSDVYSFGVVLLEIITRKPAKYDGCNSLPIDFIKTCKVEGNGRKMYDGDLLTADNDAKSHVHMECLDRIAELAVQCLKEDDDERPIMEDILEELKQVKLRASG